MAGKPELSAAPGVQNVVVYVSDGNFAQAYAVSQQNVATFNSQASYPSVQTNNVVYSNTANTMAPMVGANKTFQDKVVKTPEHHTINGQLITEDGCFNNGPQAVIQQNGFQQQSDYNLINNTALVNNSFVNSAVKNVCNFGGNDGESDRRDSKNEECDSFIATASTDSGYVSVMGAEGVTQTTRCDSVRSETAESSCSSLSSVDDNLVIVQPHSSEMVVYDSGGVGVRPGGVVLTVGPSETTVAQTGLAPLIRTLPANTFANVPFGWKRLLTNGVIIYISPSNTALSSLDQVRDYLLTPGTCKCGLECPLKYDTVFNFDPKVASKPWIFTPDTNTGDLTKLCNHKRKIMAMASMAYKQTDPIKFRKDFSVKRKKRKIGGSFSGIPISQILAQKEKLSLYQPPMNRTHLQQPWPNSVMNPQHRVCADTIVSPSETVNSQYLRHPNVEPIVNNRLLNNPFRDGGQHIQSLPPGATSITQQMHGSPVLQPNVHVHPNGSQSNGQVHLHHQHHLVAPSGHVLSIQQGNPHPQGSNSIVNSGSVISNGPNIILNSRNGTSVHQTNQKIFINNNQQGEPSGPGRPSIHMLPIASNMTPQQKQENHPRFPQQPATNPTVHYHSMVQQFDGNKNVKIPFVHQGAICQLRPDQQGAIVPQQNQINVSMPNSVMIQHQQQKLNWPNRQVNMTSQQQNQPNVVACSNVLNPNVCERVPPLHQHTPTSFVWQDDMTRKKVKIARTSKRRPFNTIDNQHRIPIVDSHTPCPNIDIRQIQNENKSIVLNQNQTPSSPSFMEDPSGYLAQQTALLNSTISRQTGAINCAGFNCTSPVQNISVQTVPNSSQPNEVPLPSTVVLGSQMKQTQNYIASNGQNFMRSSQIPQHLDNQQQYHQTTAVMAREAADSTALNEHVQCQGCTDNGVHFVTQKDDSSESCNSFVIREHPQVLKQNSRPNSEPNTPSSSNIVEDPVTSSNCLDRQGSAASSPDFRPIQGGAISTSHVSPAEGYQSNPPTPTPHSLTPQPRLESSQSNVHISNPGTPVSFVENSNTGQFHHLSLLFNNNNNSNPPTSSAKQEVLCSSAQSHPQQSFMMSRVSVNDHHTPHSGIVTTMASGRTFSCNTITSVLAGRANTSTVSVNSPVNVNVPLSTISQVPQSHSDPQVSIATTTLLSTNTKSPLEMVQSVVSSIQVPHSHHNTLSANLHQNQQMSPVQVIKPAHNMHPNHVLVSSGGQFILANTSSGQSNVMPPPPPKVQNQNAMPPISVSPMITNVTAAVTQVIPAVAQQVLGQQTVLVNALPTPFVLQPGVTMTMEGMTVGQNMQIPQIVAGNVIQQQLQVDNSDPNRIINRNAAMLSPEAKRKGKKRKIPSQTIASMLHIASQQNSGMMVPQQNFPQQIQMAHSPQNIATGPVMQALTIVPGKAGGPPQIVMNGQAVGNSSQFGAQPIINSQQAQQFNLLQPVSLLNGTTGMVQNFPAIQQFILPNLGSMVMNADGTATLLQDTSNIGMQLQLQNVNGQNVLTPVQNNNMFNGGQSILAAGPAGMVIRAPGTNQNKIIQQQHSPGAQFLSPNGNQFVVNGTQFSGQLSPLVANVSPTQQVTFNATPQQIRPNNSAQQAQQEFIQCGQMGQTLMVPAASISVSSPNQQNTTFVQQNTTIVQQQTTMVSNNQQLQNIQGNSHSSNNQNIQVRGGPQATLNVDPGFLINASDNRQCVQALLLHRESPQASSVHCRHSVSTQTAVNQTNQSVTTNTFCQTSATSAGSPPDTTTHSPLATEHSSLPTAADTTTHTGSTDDGLSPTPSNSSGSCSDVITMQAKQQSCSMAMVHCISSSEPDSAEITLSNYESEWSGNQQHQQQQQHLHHIQTKSDLSDISNTTGGAHVHIIKKSHTPIHMACAESSTTISGIHYVADHNNHLKTDEMEFDAKHYEKFIHKRKHSDTLVVMESRQMHSSLFEDDEEDKSPKKSKSDPESFVAGDLVWGPAKGRPAWPGKLIEVSNDKVLVKWFGGDKTSIEVDPSLLQTLSQGLDAYHQSRKNCRKGRKLDSQLENAIQEAMTELDRMSKEEINAVVEEKEISAPVLSTKKTPSRLRSNR